MSKENKVSYCKLCQEELKGSSLSCSKGTICTKCQKDISSAEFQPIHSSGNVLWILAETYFRKGHGEDVTFEQVWNENENLKLVKFEEIWGRLNKKDE